MDAKEVVLNILEDLIGKDLNDQMDENTFDNDLLDLLATVQMLLDLQGEIGTQVLVSEFNREEWNTPNKIMARVESSEND